MTTHNIASVDDKFLTVLNRTREPDNTVFTFNVTNPQMKLAVISDVYETRILYSSGAPCSQGIKGISRITCGVSEDQAVDVTSPLMTYLTKWRILTPEDNLVPLLGESPTERKIFVYGANPTPGIVLEVVASRLKSHLIFLKKQTVPNILLYVIYFDDKTYQMVEKYKDRDYVRLINNGSTKYFESNLFRHLANLRREWIGRDYVGILAYSSERKLGTTIDAVHTEMVRVLNESPCALLTLANYNSPLTTHFHGNIQSIFNKTLPRVGFPRRIPYESIQGFYCNYWVVRSLCMANYVEFAIRYMNLLNDPKNVALQKLLNNDSGYQGGIPREILVNMTGFPHYTHHCFVMERLPCLYFWKHNFRKIPTNSWIQGYRRIPEAEPAVKTSGLPSQHRRRANAPAVSRIRRTTRPSVGVRRRK